MNPFLALIAAGMDMLPRHRYGGQFAPSPRRNWKRKTRRYRHH